MWIYDTEPNKETLYQLLEVFNSQNPEKTRVYAGIQDFDAFCYSALIGGTIGPNAICGIYPQQSTAPIKRTPGWHNLEVSIGASQVTVSIDAKPVVSASIDVSVDTVDFYVSGPAWRVPSTPVYVYADDFSFIPLCGCVSGK